MSITSRINEMSSHIEQAYDELQGLGADLTNVNKNIENISMVLDDIYDSMPQVSGEGTSLTLDNTRVGKIKSTLKGNTSQTGTPTPTSPIPVNVVSGDNEIGVCGKNLLNLQTFVKGRLDSGVVGYDSGTTSITATQDSITFTTNANYRGVTSDFIIVEPSTDYILHQDTSLTGISMTTACYDSNKTYLGNATNTNIDSNTKKFTMLANTKLFRLNYQLNSAGTITINKPQLEKGTTPTDFDPYQSNTYNIDLPVENLFDKSTATLNNGVSSSTGNLYNNNDSFATDYIPIQNGKSYTMNSYSSSNVCFGSLYDSSKAFLEGFTTSQNNKTVTINNANAKYIRITGQKVNIDTWQLEKGSKQNNFTPYGTTPIELCKIGNYQDYIYKDSGKWYLHKEIGKVVLNGSETFGNGWNYQNGCFTLYDIPNIIKTSAYADRNQILVMSDYFKAGLSDYRGAISETDYQIAKAIDSNGTQIAISFSDYTSLSDFITWLSSHNLKVYYVLLTPTNTEITYEPLIEQLNELEKAMSKDGQTNISQVNNDLPFIISASALKEWQESTSLNSTLSMVNPLSLGNTLNTQENNIQPIEVDNIEPLEEEENEES